jgi:hypothetical protein
MYIPVFLAILLIALWFQLNVSEGFTPLWASEDKKDYGGNDIANSPLTNISLGDCKKKCIGDATCKGIVTDFSGDGPGGNCWMKNAWGSSTDNDSRFTYKLTRR